MTKLIDEKYGKTHKTGDTGRHWRRHKKFRCPKKILINRLVLN